MWVAENRIRNTGPFTSESHGVSLHTLFEIFHLLQKLPEIGQNRPRGGPCLAKPYLNHWSGCLPL